MIGLKVEGTAFLQAVLSGMIVCSGYICIRRLRRVIRHNLIVIAIEDAIFWLVSSVYLFVQIYYTSDGSIRWYFVLGVALGVVLVNCLVRKLEKIREKNVRGGKKNSGQSLEFDEKKR